LNELKEFCSQNKYDMPINAYKSTILCYSFESNKHSGSNAERILNQMIKDGFCEPNANLYTCVIGAYANSKDGAIHAERVHNDMIHVSVRPDARAQRQSQYY